MTSTSPLNIYLGQTIHQRFLPFIHRFRYRLLLVDIDIDRLEEAARISPLFAINRPGLFSFRRRDHGDRTDAPLRPWATQRFDEAGIALDGGPVRLITFARHLFYKFAPISLWFGYGPDKDLRGVIYEVNNTFGDSHAYVARCTSAGGQHQAEKRLHVSPFFDTDGGYRFQVRAPGARLSLVIDHYQGGERQHMAALTAIRSPLTSGRLLKAAVTMPASAFGVSVGIHWEALKLWLKGAGYRRRPAPVVDSATVATAEPAPGTLLAEDECR